MSASLESAPREAAMARPVWFGLGAAMRLRLALVPREAASAAPPVWADGEQQ